MGGTTTDPVCNNDLGSLWDTEKRTRRVAEKGQRWQTQTSRCWSKERRMDREGRGAEEKGGTERGDTRKSRGWCVGGVSGWLIVRWAGMQSREEGMREREAEEMKRWRRWGGGYQPAVTRKEHRREKQEFNWGNTRHFLSNFSKIDKLHHLVTATRKC